MSLKDTGQKITGEIMAWTMVLFSVIIVSVILLNFNKSINDAGIGYSVTVGAEVTNNN